MPWVTDDEGGYFEYIEGDVSDASSIGADSTRRFGDSDDKLFFTARSANRPYQGSINGAMVESPEAEIAWVCREDITPAGEIIRTVHRRVLLIAPWAAGSLVWPPSGTDLNGLAQFQALHDLSARLEGGNVILNTVQDLSLRENRFLHAAGFPHLAVAYTPLDGARLGEDVVLRNALAFDVRIFDSGAPLFSISGVAVGPSDVGFNVSNVNAGVTPDGFGAYVDLGTAWLACSMPSGAPSTQFMMPALAKSNLVRTFDTWPEAYERDGKMQASGMLDFATNGLDDDNAAGIDDVGERETSAPYLASPQGIQVKLRAYEGDARQIREVTVNQNFAT